MNDFYRDLIHVPALLFVFFFRSLFKKSQLSIINLSFLLFRFHVI